MSNDTAKPARYFRRRQVPVPTWRTWLVLGGLGGGLILIAMTVLHPFLATTRRLPAQALVVEGWTSTFTMERALAEFRTNQYERVLVTGGPLESGAPLSEYRTYAELGAATLVRLGLASNLVTAVPAPRVRQDRTYISAVVLKDWFATNQYRPSAINVLTDATHARRSWLLFGKVLEPETQVGVLAIPPREYEPRRWWRSSYGFRAVIGETLAYLYARLLFTPPDPDELRRETELSGSPVPDPA